MAKRKNKNNIIRVEFSREDIKKIVDAIIKQNPLVFKRLAEL